jgi:hypothetical protein
MVGEGGVDTAVVAGGNGEIFNLRAMFSILWRRL